MSTLPQDLTVERVTVRSAPGDVLVALHAVAHEIEREDLPEPPWEPQAEWVAELRGDAGIRDRADWVVRDRTGRPVATGSFAAKRNGENRHRAQLVVRVVPEQRRRGVGTHLLRLAAHAGLEGGRTVVQTWTSAGGAGAAFADAHGIVAQDDLELNRLRTVDLDRELLTTWVERAPTGAAGYELVAWDGPCPPPLRRGYAAAREPMNTAPQTPTSRRSPPPSAPERRRASSLRQVVAHPPPGCCDRVTSSASRGRRGPGRRAGALSPPRPGAAGVPARSRCAGSRSCPRRSP